jgi:hypothetical protein
MSQLYPIIKICKCGPTVDKNDILIVAECVSDDDVKCNYIVVKAVAGFVVLCDIATQPWRT